MLELSHADGQTARLAYGGDTLNTAIYLARMGLAPHYLTALGNDPYSDQMLAAWEKEGIQTDLVLRHPTRLPGLYTIQTDDWGERCFYYWRDESAARAFFDLPAHDAALAEATEADWLYLTGITLSIFDKAGRDRLVETAKAVRARGGQVVFDPNYRPKGWPSADAAWIAMMPFAKQTTIALPTIDDENVLHGEASSGEHAARWHELGVSKVLMKCGPDGATLFEHGREPVRIPAERQVAPKDTTGAGDSFNAALIHGLATGQSLEDAARDGNRLAAFVIQHSGAIAPHSGMPGFRRLGTKAFASEE